MKSIKGTINFEIKIKDNTVETVYDISKDNEIGALAISELILNDTANYYLHLKNTTTGKDRASREKLKMFTAQANVLKKGRTGVARILNMLLSAYDGFNKHLEERDAKSEEIKEYLKNQNITVENGKLSAEEAEKLLGDKFKDLKSSPESPEKTVIYKLENDNILTRDEFIKENNLPENHFDSSVGDENSTNL